MIGNQRARAWRGARAAIVPILASAVAACASETAPPTPAELRVQFPSTAAAVSTESLQVLVFDHDATGGCLELVQKRRTNQPLPPALVTAGPTPSCEFFAGAAPNVRVDYGARSVLIIGQRAAQDWLIGCTEAQVGDEGGVSPLVQVPLTLASRTVSVPATTCTTLGDHCANRCP